MKTGRTVPWCPGLHAARRIERHIARHIARRWSIALMLLAGASISAPSVAHADDWGCQVLLCLSNPGGPEQYSECVPPIEKLWSALRHGDPFPACDFRTGGSQGTFATNTFASGAYCREDLLYWGGPEQSELLCRATGAINVEIDNQLYTRIWRDVSGQDRTLTEFYGAGSAQIPYDPSQSASRFLQQTEQQDGATGGGQ
ncbi:hypothetical protein [Paraburkholderia heleia]|uniref:hypothetical protein n=1 Tax=Paraburkholderia heleia TaxID=634127 RepID=UPI003CD0606F